LGPGVKAMAVANTNKALSSERGMPRDNMKSV